MGCREILWQSRVGFPIGVPLVQGDELVDRLARMAQHQSHRRLGTQGRMQAPGGGGQNCGSAD
mgnify:CR=1 FL=1